MEAHSQQATPLAVGIRYGLLLALTALLVDFLTRIAGFSFVVYGTAAFVGWLIVSIAWIITAHKAFKNANGGYMQIGQGLTIAVVMLLLSGVVSGFFNYVYLHYIDLDFLERMKQDMVDFMERNNIPDEQIEKSTARIGEMKTGLGRALLGGLSSGLASGVIIGLLVSAFTKRNPSEFE
ncbi:DUF4199 domain-containing protein [Hymenobacter sp. B1770]|uniref:DUF4199 domain-containing protein n=1 Tax=Hymenobacter sp. B1770 TaxID=1718788 RepID=UPI003CEF7DA0